MFGLSNLSQHWKLHIQNKNDPDLHAVTMHVVCYVDNVEHESRDICAQ